MLPIGNYMQYGVKDHTTLIQDHPLLYHLLLSGTYMIRYSFYIGFYKHNN